MQDFSSISASISPRPNLGTELERVRASSRLCPVVFRVVSEALICAVDQRQRFGLACTCLQVSRVIRFGLYAMKTSRFNRPIELRAKLELCGL